MLFPMLWSIFLYVLGGGWAMREPPVPAKSSVALENQQPRDCYNIGGIKPFWRNYDYELLYLSKNLLGFI